MKLIKRKYNAAQIWQDFFGGSELTSALPQQTASAESNHSEDEYDDEQIWRDFFGQGESEIPQQEPSVFTEIAHSGANDVEQTFQYFFGGGETSVAAEEPAIPSETQPEQHESAASFSFTETQYKLMQDIWARNQVEEAPSNTAIEDTHSQPTTKNGLGN